MSFETALLSALTTVTGGLCYLFKLLWKKSERCERDRVELRRRVEGLEHTGGVSHGTVKMYERCSQSQCPFKPQPLAGPQGPLP